MNHRLFTAALLLSSSEGVWRKGMNPGMMLRVDEFSVEAMKSVITRLLPVYVHQDMGLPSEYHYEYTSRIPGLDWKVDWEDIKYSDLDLKMEDIRFELTRMDGTWGEVLMDIPALKYWEISANQKFDHWYLPSNSEIYMTIENFDIDFGIDLKLDDDGYLDPVVWDVMIDFGNTHIHHDNAFISYFIMQIFSLGKVIIQNSAFFLGDKMFS